jgi:hypothetical protein
MLDSKVVLHTASTIGNEAITYELTIPKWMVAELNTHKCEIERVSASSRAIPVATVISMVMTDSFLPEKWYYSHAGMIAEIEMTDEDAIYCDEVWLESRDLMVKQAEKLLKLPSGKKCEKIANRLLEPFMWTKVVVTFTLGGKIGFNNFMALRDHKTAQKEFRKVAHMMHEQYHASTPVVSDHHFPYVDDKTASLVRTHLIEQDSRRADYFDLEVDKHLALVSAARCGRVTYMNQGVHFPIEKEIDRGVSFFNEGHYSPLRHPLFEGESKWYGNQFGWIPISKLLTDDGTDYKTKCCERAK